MGNQLVGIAPSQILPVEHYLNEHPDLIFDVSLGSTRFFKVARAKSQEGLVVVKVFAIHDPSLPLAAHKSRIEQLKKILGSAVNCLPFQRAVLSDKAGFLMREFVKYSLYDRISTRPFLLPIEKKWIAYQILNALAQCHKLGVCHGDIKLENICITSWNWVLLTDFASFKPTYLPEDNPADFSYFFDTSRRRTCYIAPERFVKSLGSESGSHLLLSEDNMRKEDLKPSMDIFSAGCSLAELFADGHPPFDFSQLLAYRGGEYSVEKYLMKFEDENIRSLLESMLSKDPLSRLSAEQYLEEYKGKLFPDYFYNFLLSYNIIFSNTIPILSADEKLERMKTEIFNVINVIIDEDSKWKNAKVELEDKNDEHSGCDALVLITSMITSCIRGLHFAVSKIDTLEILVELAAHTTSEVLLDRILPYVMYLIRDPYPRVRVCAIYSLTKILSYLKVVPPSDSNVFPEYILPGLSQIPQDDEVVVRASFAENIARLAEISLKLLEYCQVNQNETYKSSYERELVTLHQMMQQMVSGLLTDSYNVVKQTLIENGITKLCVFFGKQKANDVLLSHMITFLNDKEDKQLRGSFFDCIVGVAAYIGVHSSPILSPLLQQGLTDTEEFVVRKAINAITALTELSLLHKSALYQLLDESSPFLVHPNLWIRQAAVGFISALARTLNVVDVHCKVASVIKPFLKSSLIQLDKEVLVLNALKPCIPRNVYDAVIKYNELPLLLQTLEERRNARNGIKGVSYPLPSQQTNSFRVWFNRLSSDGLNEVVEDLLLLMGKHLQKVNRYTSLEVKMYSNGKLDLTSVLKQNDFHSHPIKRNDSSKYEIYLPQLKRSNEECILTMNEEWRTMFGREGNTTAKHERSSIHSNDWNIKSSGSQSVMEHSIQERSYIQYRCAPSRLELRKLFKHRESLQGFRSPQNHRRGDVIPAGWRLRPGLVSHLHAHAGPVTRLVAIPDTTIMASCSYDGCVRIWDCGKMEGRNIANRARQVYNAQTGPLVGMTLCNANTCLGMASQSGSVVVLKFESNSNKMSVFASRHLDLDEEGPPVDITYFDSGFKSVLVYTTIYGYIIGWDLRAPGIAWKLQNDIKQGVVTALHMDNKQCFLTLGTSSGFLTTWDLRFHLPISSIAHTGGSRIRRICGHPKEPSWLISSAFGNNEVSIWCIESASRQAVLWGSSTPPLSSVNVTGNNPQAVCSMYSGVVDKDAFLLTGGTDHRIRYWDLDNYANSYVAIPAGADVVGQTSYSYKCRLIDGVKVVHEIRSKTNSKNSTDSEGPPRAGPDPPPVGHHNTITDLAVVSGTGSSLLASGASDGVIKVWK
ncbi:phosphoinositide 3-kinase regulatory subunit 4 [Halyomorpha halys]|uniref:phosphoinositide 3-kinase regulatory subunit 4 n=1 Tax=Halyomorpha halys TaxID=286706 RepID=UPI0006D4E35B|nr:phosphoinositide 3-kinase regulatory subunit 4 [Halyomorpha halys]